MDQQERIEFINVCIDQAITKLRSIRRIASKGGPVPPYHCDELREICESLRHNTDMLNRESGFST